MIQIENVLFQYSNSEKGTLKNINLHIAKGEFVVLLGRSGCGKTTITRLINRLVPEFFDGEMKGKVIIDGEDTSELNIQDLTGVVGSVFQDSRSQFFATDTTAEIAFSCENVGLPREELCRRIEKTVNYLQIEHLLERSIFELSSGEKQSIAIASVYALSPKILLLDEPSANLDTVATKHLMDILYMLKKQGYTIVVSEHRIHYLKDIADRAILIENGCITKEISGDKFRNLTNEEANQMGLRSTNITKILPCYKEIEQADKQYQLFTESVEKELYLGTRIDDQYKKKGEELLRSMDLFQFMHRHPASLSGGQKQRLCIAVACMKDTEVVCFDEPTSGLDFENMKRVSKLLQKLADEGRTILVTSHDYEFLMATCSHICHLDNGNVKDYFTLSEQTAKKTYGILF